MGFLSRPCSFAQAATWAVLLYTCAGARADTPPLFTGIEGGLNGSIGTGDIYSAGVTLQIYLGTLEDESNRSGDFHLSYLNQIGPTDPTAPDSGIKHDANWVGGFNVDIWRRLTFGIDLDSLSDPTETLQSDGARFILGLEPLTFSYRLARNVIDTSFMLNPGKANPGQRYGAFIYQHTLGLEADLPLSRSNLLSLEANYSFFEPDALAFSNFLTHSNLVAISGFQDTLQSLEEWALSATWKHDFGKRWDLTAEARVSHLIIPGIASYLTSLGAGCQISEPIHAALTWAYSDVTSTFTQNILQFELKYGWQRKTKEEEDLEDEAKKPSKRLN